MRANVNAQNSWHWEDMKRAEKHKHRQTNDGDQRQDNNHEKIEIVSFVKCKYKNDIRSSLKILSRDESTGLWGKCNLRSAQWLKKWQQGK